MGEFGEDAMVPWCRRPAANPAMLSRMVHKLAVKHSVSTEPPQSLRPGSYSGSHLAQARSCILYNLAVFEGGHCEEAIGLWRFYGLASGHLHIKCQAEHHSVPSSRRFGGPPRVSGLRESCRSSCRAPIRNSSEFILGGIRVLMIVGHLPGMYNTELCRKSPPHPLSHGSWLFMRRSDTQPCGCGAVISRRVLAVDRRHGRTSNYRRDA